MQSTHQFCAAPAAPLLLLATFGAHPAFLGIALLSVLDHRKATISPSGVDTDYPYRIILQGFRPWNQSNNGVKIGHHQGEVLLACMAVPLTGRFFLSIKLKSGATSLPFSDCRREQPLEARSLPRCHIHMTINVSKRLYGLWVVPQLVPRLWQQV